MGQAAVLWLQPPRPGIINSKISLVEGGSLYHQLRCQLQKLLKIVNQSNKKLIFYTDNLKVNFLQNSYERLFLVSTHWLDIFMYYCFISISNRNRMNLFSFIHCISVCMTEWPNWMEKNDKWKQYFEHSFEGLENQLTGNEKQNKKKMRVDFRVLVRECFLELLETLYPECFSTFNNVQGERWFN